MFSKFVSVSIKSGVVASAFAAIAFSVAAPAMAADDAAKTLKPWIKICPKLKEGSPKLCVTRADYLDRANMVPYAPVAIEEIEGKGKSIVVTLPHVWLVPAKATNKKTKEEKNVIARVGARWAILSGVVVKVDDKKEHILKYVFCDQFGCTAQAKADDALIAEMKKGKNIFVAGKNNQKTLGLPFTLTGFGDAYAGKATDETKYKKAWADQMANIRKQQIEALKKQQAAAKKASK